MSDDFFFKVFLTTPYNPNINAKSTMPKITDIILFTIKNAPKRLATIKIILM